MQPARRFSLERPMRSTAPVDPMRQGGQRTHSRLGAGQMAWERALRVAGRPIQRLGWKKPDLNFSNGGKRPERPSRWKRSHPGGRSRVAPTWVGDRRSGLKACQAFRTGLTQWISRPARSPSRRNESKSSGRQTVHRAEAVPQRSSPIPPSERACRASV